MEELQLIAALGIGMFMGGTFMVCLWILFMQGDVFIEAFLRAFLKLIKEIR